jgi:hypothetical protein
MEGSAAFSLQPYDHGKGRALKWKKYKVSTIARRLSAPQMCGTRLCNSQDLNFPYRGHHKSHVGVRYKISKFDLKWGEGGVPRCSLPHTRNILEVNKLFSLLLVCLIRKRMPFVPERPCVCQRKSAHISGQGHCDPRDSLSVVLKGSGTGLCPDFSEWRLSQG